MTHSITRLVEDGSSEDITAIERLKADMEAAGVDDLRDLPSHADRSAIGSGRLDVVLSNSGGMLDVQTAQSPVDAVRVLISMLHETGELHDGDSIRIETHADDR